MYRKPFETHFYGDDLRWFVGVVQTPSTPDPFGRVRVRVYGLHSNSTADIDTNDLPLAQVMIPGTEEGTKGLGMNAQLEVGAMVFGVFLDGKASQLPFVLGSFPRIEIADPAFSGYGAFGGAVDPSSGAVGAAGGGSTVPPLTPRNVVPPEELANDPEWQARLAAVKEEFPELEEAELYRIIQGESGFNTTALNPNSRAAGLFQFIPGTAADLGTNTATILSMSAAQQLEVYQRYLRQYNYSGGPLGMIQAAPDTYRRLIRRYGTWNAVPRTIEVYRPGSAAWRQNPPWRGSDGRITIGSIEAYYASQ